MGDAEKGALQFTNSEFIMLSLILGAGQIIGIPDPEDIKNMDEIEMAEKWNHLKGPLMEKGYIIEERGDSLLIEETVYSLLDKYISAEKLIEIQVIENGENVSGELFFCSEQGICNLSPDPAGEDTLYAYAHEDEAAVIELLKRSAESLPQMDISNEAGTKAVMNKNRYYEFVAAINMEDIPKATDLFTAGGMEPAIAADAVQGYLNKERFTLVSFYEIAFDLDEREYSPELSMFYQGKDLIYSLTTSENDDETFMVQALTKNEFLDEAEVLIRSKLL